VANRSNPPAFEQSDEPWSSSDAVGMPARSLFHSSEEYYATQFHELAHSTGHARHFDRETSPIQFPESYSKERCVGFLAEWITYAGLVWKF
jgi:antirestriction protein ArdC